jgi:hypothetical protein
MRGIAPEPWNGNVSRHASARSSLQHNACILHIVSFIASASHERLVTQGSSLQRLVLASRLRYPLSLNAKQGGTYLAWNIRTTLGNNLNDVGVGGMHTRIEREWGEVHAATRGITHAHFRPKQLECRTCCNPRLPNVTLASLAPQARMTSRACESAASCFAQPPLASPRRIFSTPVFFPCAWSRRQLGLRAARALRHRESKRV